MAARDGRVALDHLGDGSADGLDPERERRHVHQQDVARPAGQDVGLDGGAHGDHVVGVQLGVRLAAEETLDRGADGGHASGAAHEHDLVHVPDLQVRVQQGAAAALQGPLDQRPDERLELLAGHGPAPVQVVVGQGQVQVRLRVARERDLAALGCQARGLQEGGVLEQRGRDALAQAVDGEAHQGLIEVVAAQARVPVRGQHLEHAVLDRQEGHVEGAAPEVVDGDRALALLLEAVGQARGGRLVDDAQHLDPGEARGVAGGLPLSVVEVRRHGDDRGRDLGARGRLGVLHDAGEDPGRQLLRRPLLAAQLDLGELSLALGDAVGDRGLIEVQVGQPAAHQALGAEDGVRRVDERAPLGSVPDERVPLLGDVHHAGYGGGEPFGGQHLGPAVLPEGGEGVGRAEVDAHDDAGRVVVQHVEFDVAHVRRGVEGEQAPACRRSGLRGTGPGALCRWPPRAAARGCAPARGPGSGRR